MDSAILPKNQCSLTPVVFPFTLARPIDWPVQFSRKGDLEVEIGFGMGEILIHKARKAPDRNFVGIEQHWERVYKTLKAITREQAEHPDSLKNIRIIKMEARIVFERLFDERSITSIYCLFPCPWPKKGHVKHRLFSKSFLRLLNSRLQSGGTLKIVTDYYPYYKWIVGQANGTGFSCRTGTVAPRFDTKFERKWKEEGQERFFEIDFKKKKHITAAPKKDAELKSYTLDRFDFDKLRLNDCKEDLTVIFKDSFFDEKRNKAMIHALIAEEHLTQHFWITVAKKGKKWLVAKAEGQNIFPTPGISRAVDLVYQAASDT